MEASHSFLAMTGCGQKENNVSQRERVITKMLKKKDAVKETTNEDLLKLEGRYCSWGDTVHYVPNPNIFKSCHGSFLYDRDGVEFLDLQMLYSAVNFGYKTGAAAVLLLLEGKAGNTVVNVEGNRIYYQSTAEVIKRREVNISEIAIFESLGTCFGRKPEKFVYEIVEQKGRIERHL